MPIGTSATRAISLYGQVLQLPQDQHLAELRGQRGDRLVQHAPVDRAHRQRFRAVVLGTAQFEHTVVEAGQVRRAG